ncbi:MAG: methyltransferase [Alphaproteobacteria bacterium]|nr:methyltransferase [Alphaproteobacteria bacterium]
MSPPDGVDPAVAEALNTVKSVFEAAGSTVFTGDNLVVVDQIFGLGPDQAFIDAFYATQPDDNEKGWAWRLQTLLWAARNALALEGDFVECGVFRGFMSRFICDMLDFAGHDRRFWLFDSFAGLSPTWSNEIERRSLNPIYEISKSEGYLVDAVRAKFAAYPNVRIVPGFVPEVFKDACPERIAYLHVDLNAAAAEIAALEALFPRVVPGGMIVLDDYGRADYRHMHDAERAWFRDHGHPVLELPTGQGLVIKQG